jgi:glycerol kinase
MSEFVLAIDQGTTGTTTILVDESGAIVRRAYREIPQYFPQPGWVEHDPEEIWRSVVETVEEVAAKPPGRIRALGLTNQRETTILWDRDTGRPLHKAIVWQCRRTADLCRELSSHTELFRARTGLPLDAYFSGTKIRWLLERIPEARGAAAKSAAAKGGAGGSKIAFGTVDSWLLWKLTGGNVHATDCTNASRTLLYDIHHRQWDPELAGILHVPIDILPEVRNSSAHYGEVSDIPALRGVPILGVVGDQQGALFGQGCFDRGSLKNTYGTGGFLVLNTGDEAVDSKRGLVTTLAVKGDGKPCFALEGSIFIAGAAIQWLRDGLGLLAHSRESEPMARAVADNGGVYFVPALVGLGAPHWRMDARGTIVGLTRGAKREHIVRAALEAMAYQTRDVMDVMRAEAHVDPKRLAVDGGAAANDFLLQFQADILGVPVFRPRVIETTSWGAAAIAGIGAGVWKSSGEFAKLSHVDRVFEPTMSERDRGHHLRGWQRAVAQTLAVTAPD